jgi:hypothetical protein
VTGTLTESLGGRVAIVDDQPHDAKDASVVIRAAGFDPVEVGLDFESVERLVEELTQGGFRGAVFDHRLSQLRPVPFDGATAAAVCNRRDLPAILRTSFKGPFDEISIRRQRQWLPRVIHRSALAEEVAHALLFTEAELHGDIARERRPQPSVVDVVDANEDSTEMLIDVIVPAWNPVDAVTIPIGVLAPDLAGQSREQIVGRRFVAGVNVFAVEADDLFFVDARPDEDPPADFMSWTTR